MDTLTIDYETHWGTGYSLKSMPTLLYIRDPQFKVHGAALKENDAPSHWRSGKDLERYMANLNWSNTQQVAHNYLFDGLVSHEHFGATPTQRVDTVSLCRMLLCHDLSFALDEICPLLGIPGKVGGGAALAAVKNIRNLTPELEAPLAEYAIGDNDSCYKLFQLLWPMIPEDEKKFLNMTLRFSTEGRLHFDHDMANQAETEIKDDRDRKLAIVGVSKEMLRSRDKFAELLRARGVEPPTKISPRTRKETYAFSKQDPEFVLLRSNPDVADLIEAKLVWASNNAITRIENLKKITALAPHTLPVCLNPSGAHTHRLSGGGKINMQALNNGGKLRSSIIAPPGYVIVVRDLSGIELRFNMWFSGETDVLDFIRAGGDPYLMEAAGQLQLDVADMDKHTHRNERQFGKIIQLGCGFGMGDPKFRAYAATGPLGIDPIYLTAQQAWETIKGPVGYRTRHPNVVGSWHWLSDVALPAMASKHGSVQRGPITISHEAITLPGGLQMVYPNLEITEDGWKWGINKTHNIWGGTVQENIVQAGSQRLLKEQMLQIEDELGEILVHQVHDEPVALCRHDEANDVLKRMGEIMETECPWAPGLPLASEGGISDRYDVK